MSGQPTPPLLVEAFAKNATTCTPAAPVPGGKTAPFPSTSQIGVTNGAASLVDGFPPLTMTALTSGGTPPFGVDMNGILYLLSSHIAALQAGQWYGWSSTLETAMGGYAQGAIVQQAADLNAFWISTTAGNTTDPDTGGAGWMSTKPLYNSSAPTAGAHNNVALPGPSDYFLDVDTTAGNLSYTGLVAQRDMQRVTITNTGANLLTLSALTGSTSGNQFRLPTDLALVQNQSVSLQYVTAVTKWVVA